MAGVIVLAVAAGVGVVAVRAMTAVVAVRAIVVTGAAFAGIVVVAALYCVVAGAVLGSAVHLHAADSRAFQRALAAYVEALLGTCTCCTVLSLTAAAVGA